MKKLIILSHPSEKSFTYRVAKKLELLSREKGDEIEVLDLYTTDLRQDYLVFEDMKDIGKDEITKKIQEKIMWAEELVFIFPIWWGDMPAIMKNFWDANITAGFAFRYVNGKPVGLLKGKTARIIATSGSPAFLYKILFHIQFFWNLNRIGFCGIKQKSFTVFGDMNSSKSNKNKYLEKIKDLV